MANELKEVESKLLSNNYEESVVKTFIDFCNDQEYYDKITIFEDIEEGASDSCICLHMKITLNWNNNQINEFENIIRNIVSNKKAELKLNNINWNVFNNLNTNEKDKYLDETDEYLRSQLCENNDIELDDELLKLLLIGKLNNIPNLLSIINNIYNLSQLEHVLLKQQNDEKESQFENLIFNETIWTDKISPYFKKYNQTTLIQNALRTYSKRISLNSLYISYKINDFLMDYVKYILVMNNVISGLLSNKKIIPLQIDMCIVGRNYVWKNVSDFEYNIDTISDHFSKESFAANLNKMAAQTVHDTGIHDEKSQSHIQIPNFEKLFANNNIKFECVCVDLQNCNKKRLKKDMFQKIETMLENERFKRICVLIDRTNGKKENDLKMERNMIDKIYIYKVPKWNDINHKYCFETLIWKTKKAIIPNLNCRKDGKKYIGTDGDLFNRKFVTSYHINSERDIKCVQYFGLHSFLLLPFHLIKLFPCYFSDNFNGVDGKYNQEKYIYDEWCLPINTEYIMQWISFIDPKLSKIMIKKHEQYIPY